jgi:magnesium transporter
VLEAVDVPDHEISDHLADGATVWVDFCAPTPDELRVVADELGLHHLAVEDAVGPHQRPKLDHYDTHLFMAMRAVRVDAEAGRLLETEVDAFIGDRFLVTVRKGDDFALEPVLQRCDRTHDLAKHGVGFLLYSLLDVVVDGYFDAIEAFDAYYEGVSGALFSDQPLEPTRQRHWFRMRQAVVRFHRIVVPTREAISSIMRREQRVVTEPLYPYFQDVYDHVLRATESVDALRELVSTIVETNLSLRDYRQNQVMKKVTSWAAIIAVPTLITGYYGMNLPYPGAGESWGVLFSGGLMLGLSGLLWVVFRARDWL